MSSARAIIAALRDGAEPSPEDLRWFAAGLASGAVSDAQAGAFAMAVLLRGLSEGGRVALTSAMRDSGSALRWDLPGPVVDKHSTGGVGDVVSLALAPALADCGVYVPMISGRGLGHTGGTLDKLEAIPGLRVNFEQAEFRAIVAREGAAIVAASRDLAPADRRLYAVRDVTATVESIDLITASILSKKLAAGLEALVLDVKCGSGAFLPDAASAQALARALVETSKGAGCATVALITDMDQPLCRSAGNALEVIETLDLLTGAEDSARLRELTIALGGELLALCGAEGSPAAGRARISEALSSGRAAERFGRMIAAQGGPSDLLARYGDLLPKAPVVLHCPAPFSGRIGAINTRELGEAVVHLGGGRLRESDAVNPAVGLSALLAPGTEVRAGDPLCRVHAEDEAAAHTAIARLQNAFREGTPAPVKLVQDRVS
ncbi:thymidine phosphorylase [Falsigemmobacter faecalis]|uniref:Thymidine phosphorylase n=1 Tax=Falsigemmobacter faecalis TaxID=2488730 RepID=A0A3P3DW66_9RHOB|nr:thymidine phosphorylase [Falsigemmobacter faecalis]RRH76928.1 thymidine phosphorylase [Falsigemmobacter faecalis]